MMNIFLEEMKNGPYWLRQGSGLREGNATSQQYDEKVGNLRENNCLVSIFLKMGWQKADKLICFSIKLNH